LGRLRGVLARIALAAAQMGALYAPFGPDAPGGFADPGGWKCSPRYCTHHARCPGGGGLETRPGGDLAPPPEVTS
jgi:hypothetical protein